MEVVVPMAPPSAPSTPRTAAAHLHNYYYFFSSAPTSPSRPANLAYTWEEEMAAAAAAGDQAFDFARGFSGQLQEAAPILAAADELFEGGRIRPLNAPPPPAASTSAAERGRSPRPASAAASASAAAPSRSRRGTRSLSPMRGCGGGGGEEDSSPPSPRASLMRGCGSGSRKWRLRDLFLFRSSSEGRAGYTVLSSSSSPASFKKGEGGAGRKARGTPASDGAAHGGGRRTAATTTALPFHRNSLFGYLRSNPAIHSISRKLSGHSPSSSSSGRARPSAAAATT